MKRMSIIVLLLFFAAPLGALTIDLQEPTFSEGVLATEKGGVITGPGIRIQAMKITYVKKEEEGEQVGYVEAEGDLIVEFGEYLFIGSKLRYDFAARRGVLCCGRTAIDPWFFGGEEVHLNPDGSYTLYNGYATTAESTEPEWKIETEAARLRNYRFLDARNIKFRFISLPVFWMPSFHLDLDTMFDSPFRYTVRWGGAKGPRIGMSYEVFSWRGLATRVMFDYRLKRGPGGGIEMEYASPNGQEFFRSVNYIAADRTLYNDKNRTRYRFLGEYSNIMDCGRTSIIGSYDKLSDQEMATDYNDKGLHLATGRRTEIELRRQENFAIFHLLGRFRINNFQTLKQELPTLSGNLKPFVIGHTGIISENRFQLSYLELEYTNESPNEHDFNSPRYELCHTLYRPFLFNNIAITPQAGVVAIYYGNNPEKFDRWMNIGVFECTANADFYRIYGCTKHVMTPYLNYQYLTNPSTFPNDHFIFDIDDGWYRLNLLRGGISNNFYIKTGNCCIYRKVFSDIFVYAFFDSKTVPHGVPRIYNRTVWNVTTRLRETVACAWDLERNMLDHLNVRLDWTLSANAAISAEYRHRSPFYWRKADYTNFILDAFRDEEELRHSLLSDRRDTVLLNFFYRFHPNWAIALQSRSGWNRMREPSYDEFEVDFLGTFRSAWFLRVSYRHREDEDRFIFNFSIGLQRPSPTPCYVPCLEF